MSTGTLPTRPEPEVVEVACDVGPRRLFAKLRLAGERPVVTDDNLMEFSCDNCRRREGEPVLHRYNLLGELVETEVGGRVVPPPITDT